MESILEDLAMRFPEGYVCFSEGGKRLAEPQLCWRKTGYSTNINGIWHFYSRKGVLLSAGHSMGWIGQKRPPRPKKPPPAPRPKHNNQHSSQGPSEIARLVRGIARIEGRS